MTDAIQVVTTTPSQEDARRLARALVDQRLAACVQVDGPIQSVYHWQGQVEEAAEWRCLIKTRLDLFDALESAIRAIHPYQEPEILAIPVPRGSVTYLEWLRAETRSPERRVPAERCDS